MNPKWQRNLKKDTYCLFTSRTWTIYSPTNSSSSLTWLNSNNLVDKCVLLMRAQNICCIHPITLTILNKVGINVCKYFSFLLLSKANMNRMGGAVKYKTWTVRRNRTSISLKFYMRFTLITCMCVKANQTNPKGFTLPVPVHHNIKPNIPGEVVSLCCLCFVWHNLCQVFGHGTWGRY